MLEPIFNLIRSRSSMFLLGYLFAAAIYAILLMMGHLWFAHSNLEYFLLLLYPPVFYAASQYSSRIYLLVLLIAVVLSGTIIYIFSEVSMPAWGHIHNSVSVNMESAPLANMHSFITFLPLLLVVSIFFAEKIKNKVKNLNYADELRKKYEFIFNTADEFITLINRNYVYEAANQSYCRAHRQPYTKIIGKSVSEVWGQNAFTNVIKEKLDGCFTGHVIHEENCFEFATLGRRYFEVTYFPYFDDGKVTHAIVVSHDCTPHKRTEEAMQRAHDTLQFQIEEVINQLKTSYAVLQTELIQHSQEEQNK